MKIEYPFGLGFADSPEEILDRMAEIVRNEQLVHGDYIADEVDKTKCDAICGGHKFCAMGTLWFAAGEQIRENEWGLAPMESVFSDYRQESQHLFPHLPVVRAALNEAAQKRLDDQENFPYDHDLSYANGISEVPGNVAYSPDALEQLFECRRNVTHEVLLDVILEARTTVTSANPAGAA